jgi:hypothetical protein
MDTNIEYDPFYHAKMQTDADATQRIIEKTRLSALGEPIAREVIQISQTSIVLKPVK